MTSELHLRRHMCITPHAFDIVRERKAFILDCHTHELIDDEQCGLLITAHMLEDA